MTVTILISALITMLIIGAFTGGVLLGAKLSSLSGKRSDTSHAFVAENLTEEEREAAATFKQRVKEDNEAFKTMMGYNQSMAYGMRGKDGELK